MGLNLFGNVKAPDFAFPATVSKEAKADLKKAEKEKDAHDALNALLRMTLADKDIDPASLPQSIAKVEAAAKMFEASPESGIFDILLATLYNSVYLADQWKYNERELPLAPLPKDIAEWSGEQFTGKVNELYRSALSKAEALSRLKIADYSDIITADKLTRIYYPTVLDFVCSSVDESLEHDAVAIGKRYAPEGSAPYILWISKEKNVWDDPQFFKNSFEKYKDSPAASLLLGIYVNAMKDSAVEVEYADAEDAQANDKDWFPKWGVADIDSYLAAQPNAYMADWLRNLRNEMLKQTTKLNLPAFCVPGATVTVKCAVENVQDVEVELYYISEADYIKTQIDREHLKSDKPIATKSISFSETAPFRAKGEVEFKIEKSGYYAAIPKLVEGDVPYVYSLMRCVPVYPFSINGTPNPMVAVVNPLTGQPIKGVDVVYSQAKGANAKRALTDKQGVAMFDAFLSRVRGSNNELSVNYGGQAYSFSDVVPASTRGTQQRTSAVISVLTDRALYHPGDKVHALFVASEMNMDAKCKKSGTVISGVEIEAVLRDANWQDIDTVKIVTDEYGRATAEFSLPAEGLTGNFHIEAETNAANGSANFMVSDYRMPDFEIEVKSTLRDEPSAGCVTLKGSATYYSGMPVADATVSVTLSKSSYWRWYSSAEQVFATEIETDENGDFSITFGKDNLQGGNGNFYVAEFSAVSPSGTTAACSSSFIVGKKYVIDLANVDVVDGELPFSPSVKAVDADGNTADIELKWSLIQNKTVTDQGLIGKPIDLKKVRPGRYEFKVAPADTTLAEAASFPMLIYNVKSGIAPTDGLWTPKGSIDYVPGASAQALIASPREATVYCFVNVGDSLMELETIDMEPGYKTLKFDMPASAEQGAKLVIASVYDFNLSSIAIELSAKKDNGLKIVGETFRDKLVPGQTETWKLRLVDGQGQPVNGAVALDMFNKALDAIHPYSPSIRMANLYFRNYLYLDSPYGYSPYVTVYHNLPKVKYAALSAPAFESYGQSFGPEMRVAGYSSRMYKSAMDYNAVMADAAVYDMAAESAEPESAEVTADTAGAAGGESAQSMQQADYRDADVPMAIWAPTLSTDADGNLCYTFTVPNANTTWKLNALAWTKDLKQGNLQREFVASKPIMVAPNPPRFLRQGDVCQIVASVLNNSDSACLATTVVEIFNPASGEVLDSKSFENALQPKGNADVAMTVEAGFGLPAIGYRVRTDNGQGYADGEQSVIPVLASKAALVETTPFYLNPGEKAYSATLPAEDGARLSLTFCENPAWTIVTALPGLRALDTDYANCAAAAIFSAAISKGIIADNPGIASALKAWKENPSDSTLMSMLEKNSDLKIAMLNASPWVQAAQSQSERMAALAMILDGMDADKSIAKSMTALSKLQMEDGGWAWAGWCDDSSVWVTANVLDMLGQLKLYGWLPKSKDLDKMIAKAVKYYDAAVKDEDIMYAIVRRRFPEIPISLNGQKVISKTTAGINKNWKKYSDPAYKAMAAEALYLNNYPTMSKQLMRSISEFGVMTPSQGLTFPSVNALYDYGQILNAYALILPNAPQVDGLRQQLIVRKQGTDWGSAVVTTEVVAAIISSGSKWTVPAQGAAITAGSHKIAPSAIETATGCLRADLSPYAGEKLEIATSGTGPAYGAIYAQFDKKMSDVKASACDDLDIEKTLTVRQSDGSWEYADSLKVGDRVKVQLTIHSKRNLQFVEIIDERPAAFQPVDQLPGWLWAEGASFYRENRDAYTALHIQSLRPGTYVLSYEMNVGQAGDFSSGVATIQSQYAPEISAHSSGATLNIAQ